MLRSKATAALMRLKEMDRKYNTKRVQSNVSTESSIEESSVSVKVKSRNLSNGDGQVVAVTVMQEEIRAKASPKSKMKLRIPINPSKEDDSSISDSVTLKKSPKVPSRATSVTENSKNIEAEEEIDNSMHKNSPRSVSTLESISKVEIKASISESGDFLGDSHASDESSIATMLSRRSEASEIISEAINSANQSFSIKNDGKSNVPEVTAPNTDNNETTIEEVIRMSEDKSEIISEMSNETNRNVFGENLSTGEEQKSRYEDDTFEEASSSVGSASSVGERLKKTSEEDTIISGVKRIKITPHKRTESVQKITIDEDRDKEIVELVAPKIMRSTSECDIGLDEELSNYVRTTKNVDEAVPITLLKVSKQTTQPKRHARRSKRHRKSSNENTEEKTDSSSEPERFKQRKENNMEAEVMGDKGSSVSVKNLKSEKRIEMETSLPTERNGEEYVDKTESRKSKIEMNDGEPETVSSEEKFLRETPKKSDVTSTLRKLNKDAINAIVRRHKIETAKGVSNKSRHCKNCGNVVKLPNASRNVEDGDSDASSLENLKTKPLETTDVGNDQRSKEKKSKNKKASRSSKSRKSSNCSKVEGKNSRFDCRQTHRLRRHAAAFRLQQEREDIHNYLLELENTRLEFGPGEFMASSQLGSFKPLEFPKIAAFVKPDVEDANFKVKDEVAGLQERIVMIRQWLKDQYTLYRDYSSLAQTVNSKYIPASLEDAKRTIQQLQRATIKSR